MGTKEKFWYRKLGEGEQEWLFKHPRENTGEHWAEKIAAEIASVLGVSHATVELAELLGQRGSVSKSWRVEEHEAGWLGPSLDHASSLGRELLDGKRSLLLQEDRIGAYSEKGRPGAGPSG